MTSGAHASGDACARTAVRRGRWDTARIVFVFIVVFIVDAEDDDDDAEDVARDARDVHIDRAADDACMTRVTRVRR